MLRPKLFEELTELNEKNEITNLDPIEIGSEMAFKNHSPVPEKCISEVAGEPRVKDLMSKDLFTVMSTDCLEVIFELMEWRKIRHLPVVNVAGQLMGIVSQRDCLRVSLSTWSKPPNYAVNGLNRKITAGDISTKKLTCVQESTPLSDAAALLIENKFGCLPVTSAGNKLVGILTEADFVKSFRDWKVSFLPY